jgi:hypothetical protein
MFDWSSPHPAWIVFALGASGLGLIVLARRLAISHPLRRWTLFIPRVLVLGMLLWILLNPVRRQEHRLPAQPAQVQYLLDSSRSMALESPASRASRVQQAIGETDRLLRTASDLPRLQMFRFGTKLAPLPDLGQLQPTDDGSRLAAALEQLPARFSREAPRCVVVFSDGAIDDEAALENAAKLLAALQVPVHVYPVGDRRIRGDVSIEELVIPPRVDAGTKATIRGVVRGTGYAGERLVLTVRPADRPQAAALATLPLTRSNCLSRPVPKPRIWCSKHRCSRGRRPNATTGSPSNWERDAARCACSTWRGPPAMSITGSTTPCRKTKTSSACLWWPTISTCSGRGWYV